MTEWWKFDEAARRQRISDVLSNIATFSTGVEEGDTTEGGYFHPGLDMTYKSLVESRISDNMGTPSMEEVLMIAILCAVAAFVADVMGRGIIARGRQLVRSAADRKKKTDDDGEEDNDDESNDFATPFGTLVRAYVVEFAVYFLTLSSVICGLWAFTYSVTTSNPSDNPRRMDFVTAPSAVMKEYLVYLGVLLFTILNVCMGAYCFFAPDVTKEMLAADKSERRRKDKANSTSQQHDTVLTLFRACLMLLTLYSILAVDFPIFPFRHIKCETFGMSLMDTGVGCFVFSAAYTVAVKKRKPGKSMDNLQMSLQWLGSSIPLFMIGGTRFALNVMSDYHEHVTEYGKHWNFFITLGVLPFLYIVFSVLLMEKLVVGTIFRGQKNELTAFLLNPLVQGVGVLATYQLMLILPLQSLTLTEFIMGPHRRNFLESNKEGIASSFGYLGLYLVTIGGARLLSSSGTSSSLEENEEKEKQNHSLFDALNQKVSSVMREYNTVLEDLEQCWITLQRTNRAEAKAMEENNKVSALNDTLEYIILSQRSRFYEEAIVSDVCANLRLIGDYFRRSTRMYLSMALAVAFYIINQMLHLVVQPNSRRLCNAAYVSFILCLCFSSLAALITLEHFFFARVRIDHYISVCVPPQNASSDPSVRRFNKTGSDKKDYVTVSGNTEMYAATLVRDLKLREIHTQKMRLQMAALRKVLGDDAPPPLINPPSNNDADQKQQAAPATTAKATTGTKGGGSSKRPCSLMSESLIANAINYNQFFIFLIGNLSTGLFNKTMQTIFADPFTSHAVMALYLSWVCGVSCVLYVKQLRMKFW